MFGYLASMFFGGICSVLYCCTSVMIRKVRVGAHCIAARGPCAQLRNAWPLCSSGYLASMFFGGICLALYCCTSVIIGEHWIAARGLSAHLRNTGYFLVLGYMFGFVLLLFCCH